MARLVEVVAWDDIERTIRSAIRVHARKAGHKDQDIKQGCEMCTLLMAMDWNLHRDAILADVTPEVSSQGDG
jgi:hypothetical protein